MPLDEPALQPELVVICNGERHDGWKSCSVRFGIEELVPSFSLDYADRWTSRGRSVPLRAWDEIEIKLEGGVSRLNKTVFTGAVSAPRKQYDASSRSLSVTGQSKTFDLTTCTFTRGATIKGKTLEQVAKQICDAYQIDVEVLDPALRLDERFNARIERVRIESGNRPHEVLSPLARHAGVLMVTTPKGSLGFTRSAKLPLPNVEIRYGQNVKSGSFTEDVGERFSEYHFKAQSQGSDQWPGAQAGQATAVVQDAAVKRFRPMVVTSEKAGHRDELAQRALWERNIRAARSLQLSYTVPAWTHHLGLWEPNTIVRCVDTEFEIDDGVLITGVELVRNMESGRIANLEITGVGAYDVLDPPKIKRKTKNASVKL